MLRAKAGGEEVTYQAMKPWIRLAFVLAILGSSRVEPSNVFDGLGAKDGYTLALLTALVFVP